jgi:hypothetical protein
MPSNHKRNRLGLPQHDVLPFHSLSTSFIIVAHAGLAELVLLQLSEQADAHRIGSRSIAIAGRLSDQIAVTVLNRTERRRSGCFANGSYHLTENL